MLKDQRRYYHFFKNAHWARWPFILIILCLLFPFIAHFVGYKIGYVSYIIKVLPLVISGTTFILVFFPQLIYNLSLLAIVELF